MPDDDLLDKRLNERREQQAFRRLRLPDGATDLCSNDYLGIATNGLIEARWGTGAAGSGAEKAGNSAAGDRPLRHGSAGSRLLAGNYPLIEETEGRIAGFHDAESGLIFNSGYDANLGLLSCVPQRGDTVFYDQLSHASIRDGLRLSFARSLPFAHNDAAELEQRLRWARGKEHEEEGGKREGSQKEERQGGEGAKREGSQKEERQGGEGAKREGSQREERQGEEGAKREGWQMEKGQEEEGQQVRDQGEKGQREEGQQVRDQEEGRQGEKGQKEEGQKVGGQPAGNIFVVTESVFSMDGDQAPLRAIAALCRRYGAKLIVDEAHATGVVGTKGEGLVQTLGLQQECFARVHTFGKAVGCHGAIVLGSSKLRDYLINFCRAFIYTTALPETSVRAIQIAYSVFPGLHAERDHLQKLIDKFQQTPLAFEKLNSRTPIQVVIVPGNEAARALASKLQTAGLDVRPILYPTVPKGSERLRIVLHSFNMPEEIDRLIKELQ